MSDNGQKLPSHNNQIIGSSSFRRTVANFQTRKEKACDCEAHPSEHNNLIYINATWASS
jgi:hypothetical protein